MNRRMWKLGSHAEHHSSWLIMSDIWASWIISLSWVSFFKSITVEPFCHSRTMLPARLMAVSYTQNMDKTLSIECNPPASSAAASVMVCLDFPGKWNVNAMLVGSQVRRYLWSHECQISPWTVANKQTDRWHITIRTTLWAINEAVDTKLPFICSVCACVWCFFTSL